MGRGPTGAGQDERPAQDGKATAGRDYASRLVRSRSVWWKNVIDVQLPYRWNIRRLHLGRTLDIGCGIGRNLHHLGGSAVGVDHNSDSVAIARSYGLTAYTGEDFGSSTDAVPAGYDTLLLAHVVEHMDRDHAVEILEGYLKYLKPGGRVVLITPQEAGYRTDSTHVRFVDFASAADLAAAIGFEPVQQYSFPFPRMVGRFFPYNEFVTVCRTAAHP
jgi:2-polyprenyl-3-methyl-5-hydroxy-6-metoxy-1,4-benzoquinol methylase